MAFKLHRRTLLRGAAGVGVALPLLECMIDGHKIAAQPGAGVTRYALVFAGQSLGGDNYAKNEQRVAGTSRTEDGHFIAPAAYGRGWGVTTPLEPLTSLRDEFSIVSNLRMPYSATSADGADVPPGGAYRDHHGGSCSPLMSGTRSTEARFTCNGPTSDQVVADQIGMTTHPSLVYRAQPSWYLSGSDFSGRQYISYRGARDPIEAQTSPRIAYMSLFGGFTPDDGAAAAQLDFELRARRSVLDLILGKRAALVGKVGTVDRQRLERHFDELRALELRIAAIPPVTTGNCAVPTDPGSDPAIGGNNTGAGSDEIVPGLGYSNEHERAQVMCDLIHMAFACDLTRVATLQITSFQSHMSVLPVSEMMGLPIHADLHEVGHNGDANNRGQQVVSTMLKWHITHYAYLLQKMLDTPEGGGTMLDSSAVVFTAEGGHGRQLNDATTENQTHSTEQMVMLLGGRAGGLAPGQHIDGAGRHPAQVLISGMQAAGLSTDTLGDVTGNVSELFT